MNAVIEFVDGAMGADTLFLAADILISCSFVKMMEFNYLGFWITFWDVTYCT